jgi:hypothetical protein
MAIASPTDGHIVQPPWRQLLGLYNGSADAEDGKRTRGYLKDRPQQPWTHTVPDGTGGP